MARRQEWAFQPIENLSLRRISRAMGFANERDFPVPSEPRPVEVAVYGN
jgi:uncharacterized protein (DUF2132 family)